MKIHRHTSTALSLCGVLLFTSLAHAQMGGQTQVTPRINYVLPIGGQAGTTFEVKVTGQDLTDVQGLYFSFPGATAEPIESTDKKDIKKQPVKPAPALSTHRFKVTLPANAPLGTQDVRIITKAGISNPRAFVVSDQKESVEEEPNDDVPKAQKIDLNCTVSGVISAPTDVDYYAFTGKKGQRVVFACMTSSIDSRLPAAIQVYGPEEIYLGSNRNFSSNDAVLDAVLPADGEYFVRVFSFSYTQGGIDYFYRLAVTTAPWIDAVFPSVVEPGKEAQVTVYGKNLPGGKTDPDAIVNERAVEKVVMTVKASKDPATLQRLTFTGFLSPYSSMLDGFDYRTKNDAGSSNPFLMTYANAPVVLDAGNNDAQETPQNISVPCVISGRVEKKADRDWYAFTVKKGQVLNIEAFAERLGAPMDLFFQVRDEKGLIVEQDDTAEVLSPQFFTSNADPLKYRFVAPADATYHLMVTSRDAFTQFGPRHQYTVRIAPEEPDFRLVAMPPSQLIPEANVVNQAGGAAFVVYVWRFGGFNDDILLSGENLPQGISVKPQIIPSGQKLAVLAVHADADTKLWAGAIKVVGTAASKGQKLTREVRSATITWPVAQNNVPSITRLDRELVLAVRDKAPYSLVVGTQKINVLQGEKISIPVKLAPSDTFKTAVQIAALGGPTGLTAIPITLTPGQAGGTAVLDVKGGTQITPGNYTIFLRGQTQPINPKQPPKGPLPPNYVQVSIPVSVTIVPKVLGKITATPAAPKVSLGKEVEVSVKFARAYDLPLELKVEAMLPPNIKGISAKSVTIKAGDDEAIIVFTVAANAQIGTTPLITIRATAMFNETLPIVHETKITLAIAK